jgi:hypothetical protein
MQRAIQFVTVLVALFTGAIAVQTRAADNYASTVLADGPVGYWRLDEPYGGPLHVPGHCGSGSSGA